MGFHAGFITVEYEQISLAAVSDPSACTDQSGWEFGEELDRCAVCVEAELLSMWEAANWAVAQETCEYLRLSRPKC